MEMKTPQLNAETANNSVTLWLIVRTIERDSAVFFVVKTHTTLLNAQKSCASSATKSVTKLASVNLVISKCVTSAAWLATLKRDVLKFGMFKQTPTACRLDSQ